jgi:thioredoxin reductase (NADPH)
VAQGNILVYGTSWCGDCKRAKRFLGEQLIPYKWIDIDKDAEARATVERLNHGKRSVPTIVFEDGSILVEPSSTQLAQKFGIASQSKRRYYDLIIIGGGSCGLTAAAYAARERIETLLIERSGLGGQASMTDVVENVPGFMGRLSGTDFAKQITQQARRFGVEILQADVERIELVDDYRVVHLTDGASINASALLIATGATYRRLDIPGENALLGTGVHYCASCDAPFYRGADELLAIGDGDSAVKEALFLSQFANHVTIIAPGDKLTASLAAQQKLSETPTIQVKFNAVVAELHGNKKLEKVVTRNTVTGETEEHRPNGIFVFIGMAPNTWLVKDYVAVDPAGYIMTGHDLAPAVQEQLQAPVAPKHVRLPHSMETSVRGIFAAGDVRSGSAKQVTDAVAEGAGAAIAIREYLKGE